MCSLTTAVLGNALAVMAGSTAAPPPPLCPAGGSLSYNGICTPKAFPPRQNYSRAVPHPPYLVSPPAVINITVGRQLFVDDFLIANQSGLATSFHTATYYDHNPVIKPDMPWEGTFAMPFSGGVWWEDAEQRLALWYRCGGGYAEDGGRALAGRQGQRSGPSTTGTCLAYSTDGVHFNKTLQDVRPNTNMVREVACEWGCPMRACCSFQACLLSRDTCPRFAATADDGNTVWYDRGELNASRRYKMADVDAAQKYAAYTLLSSPDGVHWSVPVLHLPPSRLPPLSIHLGIQPFACTIAISIAAP